MRFLAFPVVSSDGHAWELFPSCSDLQRQLTQSRRCRRRYGGRGARDIETQADRGAAGGRSGRALRGSLRSDFV